MASKVFAEGRMEAVIRACAGCIQYSSGARQMAVDLTTRPLAIENV